MTNTYRATVLITIPKNSNDPTTYTSQWAEKAVKIANKLGYKVIVIRGKNVNYDNVTKLIRKYRPRLYAHFGHGCVTALQGQKECIVTKKLGIDTLLNMAVHDKESFSSIVNPMGNLSCPGICQLDDDICYPICMHDTNLDMLKGTIVLAFACHSAAKLGDYAIEHGADAYVGYSDLLLFPVDSMKTQELFGEIHVELFKSILMGKTVEEANEIANRLEDAYITMYKEVKYVSLPFLWNKLHRKVLGNNEAMIYQ